MALTVTKGVPSQLVAGDAASFTVTDPDFPATGWTAKIVFKDPAGQVKNFDATASGADHLFALTNAQAATLTPGLNLVCLVFTDGTHRQSGDWQAVEVLPDPTLAQSPTFAQDQVALLRKVIAEFNSTSKNAVNMNGQNFTRAGIAEYQKQLTYYEARVIAERNADASRRGVARSNVIAPSFVSDTAQGPFPTSTAAR